MTDSSDDYLEKALSAAFAPAEGGDPDAGPPAFVPSLRRGPAHPPPIPEHVGRYPIRALVGRGGMGLVLRAHDSELERPVALKILHEHLAADAEMVRRFVMEARVGSGLQHPGVVPVHELGRTEDGRPFFTMKLVEGQTLAANLASRPTPAADRLGFLSIFEKICQVVAYAHSRGVVHLDLKPANVLVGEFGEILVTDWGFAASIGDADRAPVPETPASRARIVGTPAYMAPEQAKGDTERIGPRSDVFALGGMLCEILTGAAPYVGETASEILMAASRAWLEDAGKRLDACGADGDVVQLARRCLSPDPQARPKDAGEVAAALGRYLRSLDERARSLAIEAAEARTLAGAERRQRRLTLGLAAAVTLGVVLSCGAWLWNQSERAARARDDEHQAVEAAERVRALIDAAQRTADPDPAAWEAPCTAARQAADLARARKIATDILHHLDQLVAAADVGREKAARDQRTLNNLLALREHLGDFRELGAKDRGYSEAFRGWGLDVETMDVGEVAKRVQESALRDHLLTALDDWTVARRSTRGVEDSRTLAEIANRADPDTWRVRVRSASVAADRGALEALVASPEREGQPPDTLVLLARSLRRQGLIDPSRLVLEEAQLRHPGDYGLHHDLGILHRDSVPAAIGEAIRQFSMALALRPNSAHALVDLGQALLQSGDLESAERHLQQARRVEPGSAPALHFLGVARLMKHDLAGAEDFLRQSLALDPGSAMSHAVLGIILREAGRLADSEAAFREALRIRPAHPESVTGIMNVLTARGRNAEAIAVCREALALDSEAAGLWYDLGALLMPDQPTEALAAFQECVRRDPSKAEAWCNLGLLLVEQGRFAEGRDLVRKGHELGSARGTQWRYPSDSWVAEIDALIDAERRLEQPLADLLEAKHAPDLGVLSRAAWLLGRHFSAAKLAEAALEKSPSLIVGTLPIQLFASRAAASAATGGGKEPVEPAQQAVWRDKALEWACSCLDALKLADSDPDREFAGRTLRAFSRDPALAGVRDGAALAKLPRAEREAWSAFWDRAEKLVAALRGE